MVRRSLKKVLIILISNLVILSFVRAEATDVKWTVAHLDIPEVFYGFEIGKSNRYIMVGENGIIKHSVDGLKWSACTTNDNNVLNAVLWNGEKYLGSW